MKPDKQTLQFAGRVVRVTTDEVVLPNGHRALLEVVHHPGGAAAVALDESGQVCLLRQYRYVAGGWLWELPAGRVDKGETVLHAAKRELGEETGYRARKWQKLAEFYPSPGFLAEKMTIFLATELTAGEQHAPERAGDGNENETELIGQMERREKSDHIGQAPPCLVWVLRRFKC